MRTQNTERGGIVVFAVVGILLVGLLAGGLYLGKRDARMARDTTPIVAIDTEKQATEKELAVKKQEEKKDTAAPTVTATPRTTPTAKPTTPTPSSSTPAPATPVTPAPASRATTLPSAGPSDTMFGIVMAVSLTFAGLAFVQSASRLRRSALSR